jgi:hypothetical protein
MDTQLPNASYAPFADILQVDPMGDADQLCMKEIREVLQRHQRLDRFGICLLHSHFPVGPDEILLEETDAANRCSTVRPAKMAAIDPEDIIVTMWSLRDGKAQQACTKKTHVTDDAGLQAVQACNKKVHVSDDAALRALQVCTKKEHAADGTALQALQVCTKKEHVADGTALQALQVCTKKEHVARTALQALQACTKKQHLTE